MAVRALPIANTALLGLLLAACGCGGGADDKGDLPALPSQRIVYVTITFDSRTPPEGVSPRLLEAAGGTFRRDPITREEAGKAVWQVEINVPLQADQAQIQKRLEAVPGVASVVPTGV